MIGHLPIFSANMPKGIFAAIAVKDRRLMIMPSSKVVAPFSVMYKERIGCTVSVARKSAIDVIVKR